MLRGRVYLLQVRGERFCSPEGKLALAGHIRHHRTLTALGRGFQKIVTGLTLYVRTFALTSSLEGWRKRNWTVGRNRIQPEKRSVQRKPEPCLHQSVPPLSLQSSKELLKVAICSEVLSGVRNRRDANKKRAGFSVIPVRRAPQLVRQRSKIPENDDFVNGVSLCESKLNSMISLTNLPKRTPSLTSVLAGGTITALFSLTPRCDP